MFKRAGSLLVVLTALLALAGCHPPALDYLAQLPPGTLALRKIPPEQYPSFAVNPSDLARIRTAIHFSLDYLAKPSSQHYYPYGDISHDRAVATLHALDQIAQTATSADQVDQQIRANFDVYQSVGAPAPDQSGWTGKVLFTGYFTPIYAASLTRGGPYQWPLYKRPADLVSDPVTGDVQGRRMPNGTIAAGYYTRAQIEGGALKGQELCWLTSRWSAYVVTVQGSGRLRLPDGNIYEVGYNGHNGYQYAPVAEKMIADGVISVDSVSLKTLGDYFDEHPDQMDKYLLSNPRTVFFTERRGGPFGSLNEPVTPMATIATDKEAQDIYPRAMAAFLDVPPRDPTVAPAVHGFYLDQDTGGAIRAAGRCDIYMGVGQQAEDLAGKQLSEGQLYYVAVKEELVSQYLQTASSR